MSTPGSIYVEPAELRAAVAEVEAATAALGRAAGGLEAAGDLARRGVGHAGEADHKVSTFVRQWRQEYDLLARFLDAFRAVLADAARCYEDLDAGLADCLDEAG